MPTDNVVPIDADAARVLARRSIRFRWFVAASVSVWLAMVVPVVLLTPLPPLAPFLVLAALLVLSEHRFVLFGDETSMSGSIIVAVASVFVFADSAVFAGPMLVASLGGLYLPHVRSRQFGKVAVNSTSMCFGALAASAVAASTSNAFNGSAGTRLSIVTFVAIAYWFANNLSISAYVADVDGGSFKVVFGVLLSSDTAMLLWAIAGGLLCIGRTDRPSLQFITVASIVAIHAYLSDRRLDLRPSARVRQSGLTQMIPWLLALAVVFVSDPSSAVVAAVLLTILYDVSTFGTTAPSFPLPLSLIALSAFFAPSVFVATFACAFAVALASRRRLSPHAFRIVVQVGVSTVAGLVCRMDFGPAGFGATVTAVLVAACVALAIPRALSILRMRAAVEGCALHLQLGLLLLGRREVMLSAGCVLAALGLQVSIGFGVIGAFIAIVAMNAYSAVPVPTRREIEVRAFR